MLSVVDSHWKQNVSERLTSPHDVHYRGQVLLGFLVAGNLQALVVVQRHQLYQWRQAVHTAQQHHHMVGRGEDAAQEEAPQGTEALQQACGQDEELAGVAGHLQEVVLVTVPSADVIVANPALREQAGKD